MIGAFSADVRKHLARAAVRSARVVSRVSSPAVAQANETARGTLPTPARPSIRSAPVSLAVEPPAPVSASGVDLRAKEAVPSALLAIPRENVIPVASSVAPSAEVAPAVEVLPPVEAEESRRAADAVTPAASFGVRVDAPDWAWIGAAALVLGAGLWWAHKHR